LADKPKDASKDDCNVIHEKVKKGDIRKEVNETARKYFKLIINRVIKLDNWGWECYIY
jgi:hypothetical protein